MSTPPPPWYASDVSLGERLLSMVDAAGAHNGCEHWIKVVAGHLEQWRPDSGLRAKWLSMRGSILYVGNKPNIDTRSWRLFQDGVRQRLEWLAGLPAITDQKAAASVDHPITRSDLKVAIEEAVAGRNSGDDLPIEIQKSVARFREAFPNPTKCAFIMMGFGDTKAHEQIAKGIRAVLGSNAIVGLRADDKQFHDDLLWNVLTYVHGCSFGVAVFERLLDDDFNPNVALEVGYMLALKKPVCLLKDKTMANLHTDLIGKLYRTFDPQDAFESVQPPLRAWASDKGLIVQGQYPSTNQPQTIKVNEDPRDVGRAANAVMSASPKLLQMPHN